MCGLGRLYSKQNVIEHLLEKEKMPESASHIKSLKDVRDLQLTPNPTFNKEEAKHFDSGSAPYICALIGLEMSGKFRFIALWTCGCVYSERAFIEIKDSVCSLCQKPFSEQDVVILNGLDEDTNAMRVKMEARVARRKSDKKDKKEKKTKTLPTATVTSGTVIVTDKTKVGPSTSSATTTSSTSSSKETDINVSIGVINPTIPVIGAAASSSSSTSKQSSAKTLKRSGNDGKFEDPAFKKSKDSYSVAEDPRATAVYKSLFTTHQSEKDQTRAHWVTYNPFYN